MALKWLRSHRFWGGIFSFLVLAALIALFFAYRTAAGALHGPRLSISLSHLPYYAWCSFSRMLAAYVLALVFSITYGMVAARSRSYERVMVPAIDVAQSVPVIGFFPAAVYFFVAMTEGTRAGIELAAIFLIFTSQAWNMALGVFESVKTIPSEASEALDSFGAGAWLRFRRLSLPACVPKLVYNSILSWVAGWYFLIACEIITVGPAHYRLPGLGSYLMGAADKGRGLELVAALATLLAVIVAMDFIVWQPLSVWAEKFRYELAAAGAEPMRGVVMLAALGGIGPSLTRIVQAVMRPPMRFLTRMVEAIPSPGRTAVTRRAGAARLARLVLTLIVLVGFGYAIGAGLLGLFRTLTQPWPEEVKMIPLATGASIARLVTAYAISLAWTLPCALAASESPRFNRLITPMAEILGAVPATALFPLIVLFVIKVTGGMNLASILLILTGMQWYLLFNLLAGARQVPEDLKEAARSFGLGRVGRWRRLLIPALAPSLATGSITAWGGGWNALILSEYFVYQGQTYKVTGLGALLDEATYQSGNAVMMLLSLLSMVAVVIVLNRLVWRRLYNLAVERYRLDY